MPDHAAADKIIMLAGLARIGQRKIRSAGIEIADLAAKAEAFEALLKGTHIQSQPGLKYTRG